MWQWVDTENLLLRVIKDKWQPIEKATGLVKASCRLCKHRIISQIIKNGLPIMSHLTLTYTGHMYLQSLMVKPKSTHTHTTHTHHTHTHTPHTHSTKPRFGCWRHTKMYEVIELFGTKLLIKTTQIKHVNNTHTTHTHNTTTHTHTNTHTMLFVWSWIYFLNIIQWIIHFKRVFNIQIILHG